jgi:hypothetical protein
MLTVLFTSPYSLDNKTDMDFMYKGLKPDNPRNIFLDLYGDSTRLLQKNDTIAYYYSKCENFAIRFTLGGKIDIYADLKHEQYNPVPLEILFLKRKDNLFLIILSSKYDAIHLNENYLYDFLLK